MSDPTSPEPASPEPASPEPASPEPSTVGSATPEPPAADLARPSGDPRRQPQVFRRRTTVAFAYVLVGILVGLAVFLTVGEWGHGFFPFISALAGALPLVVLALITGAWPHIVVAPDGLHVRNAFVAYDIAYPAVVDARHTRLGLLIYTNGRKPVPVTAFSSGYAGKALDHAGSATVVIHAIDNAKEFATPDENAMPARHAITRNIAAALASIAIAVVVIAVAANTYH